MELVTFDRGQRAFTLLELLIVVTLGAVLLVIGLPDLRGVILDSRMLSATSEFMSALNLARSEAILRGQRVAMCHSSDLKQCDSGNDRIWENGWLIFNDPNGNGEIDPDEGEDIVRVMEGIADGMTIRSGGHFSQFVAYLPSGMSRSNMGVGNGSFRICDERGPDAAEKVILSVTGRPRVADGDQVSIDCPDP